MKQFRIQLEIPATITKTLTVEAEDETQARERAFDFLDSQNEEHILNSEEESNWSEKDFEMRKISKVNEIDETGSPKEN
jgi:hypothetical protein